MRRRQAAAPGAPEMARLVDSSDFERVLALRSRARTVHFAVHHLPTPSEPAAEAPSGAPAGELSTQSDHPGASPVDDSIAEPLRRLGAVVPKRHAKRAVTRSLLKRQIHAAGGRHISVLPQGLWIVRLRAPFDRSHFVSAASTALRDAAKAELDQLFTAACASAAP